VRRVSLDAKPSDDELAALDARLARLEPSERLAWAVETFGDELLLTSSFGADAAPLLHLYARVAPGRPVVFIDTGFSFAETLAYRDQLAALLGLTIEVVRPARSRAELEAALGPDLPSRDPERCCAENKLAPLEGHRARARAWASGLRRDQSRGRSTVGLVERSAGEGPLKLHPLADRDDAWVRAYHDAWSLPEHPLRARRYLSIGCEPCTRAVRDGELARDGRWAGLEKTECGLHRAPGRS
jgi:phosphoadenosine phosphosulfate reductase